MYYWVYNCQPFHLLSWPEFFFFFGGGGFWQCVIIGYKYFLHYTQVVTWRTDLESTHSRLGALMAFPVIHGQQAGFTQGSVVIGYRDQVTPGRRERTNDLVKGHQYGRDVNFSVCCIVSSIQQLSKNKQLLIKKKIFSSDAWIG